jgi:radical SAM superfamily enzyme YgiQ (UPF0313 family)
MVKVLLVNPTMLEHGKFIDGYKGTRPVLPPLGLAYIAAVLEQHGHKVIILDGMVEERSMQEIGQISKGYDFVGITSTTFVALLLYKTAAAIKEANPGITIIAGGPHPTVMPEEVLKDKNIDFVTIGESEYSMLEIIEGKDPKDILGIGYKEHIWENHIDKGIKLCFTPQRPLISDLDSLPLPARHLLNMSLYRSSEVRAKRHPALHMLSSRGCPHNCSFCSNRLMHRQSLRMHSPERVIQEMETLINDYGAKEIHFWDDNLALNKDRLLKICNLIKEHGIDIPWNCESRVDTIDEERLSAMKDAGCFQISYGLESGSERVLKMVNKNITLKQIQDAIRWTNKLGMESRGYFMFGYVGETYDEMLQTLNFSHSIDLDYASFALLVPLPGSLEYEKAKKEGTFDPYYWRKQVLSDISFPKTPIYIPEGLTAEQMISIHRKAINQFYLQPKQIWKKATSMRSYSDLKRMVKGGLTLLTTSKE